MTCRRRASSTLRQRSWRGLESADSAFGTGESAKRRLEPADSAFGTGESAKRRLEPAQKVNCSDGDLNLNRTTQRINDGDLNPQGNKFEEDPSALPGGNRQRFALSARSSVRPSSAGEGWKPSDRAKSTARRIRACSAIRSEATLKNRNYRNV